MTDHPWFPDDVRQHAAEIIRHRRESLAADIDVLVSAISPEPTGDVRARLVGRVIDLLAVSLSGAGIANDPAFAALATGQDAGLRVSDLVAAVRLAERTIAEELALDDQIGATSAHWPIVSELLRSASFDLVGAFCERRLASQAGRVTDPVTSLVSRSVFEIAVAKELQRAVRYHHPVALILFDVDHLDAIIDAHGHGVGDLVLERLSVFMGQFFRQPDWVGRTGPDSMAVLLPETTVRDAQALAEGARQAVEERLVFAGKDERPVVVTVSAAVASVGLRGESVEGRESFDALRVMTEVEAGVKRARGRGGNTIERVDIARDSSSVTEAASFLHCSPGTIRKLIASGTLPALESGGRIRIDRTALEAYGRRHPSAHKQSA
jgi:diguanylate cyclase (GGDEF)-like protein/excisionase family DNA binding protein